MCVLLLCVSTHSPDRTYMRSAVALSAYPPSPLGHSYYTTDQVKCQEVFGTFSVLHKIFHFGAKILCILLNCKIAPLALRTPASGASKKKRGLAVSQAHRAPVEDGNLIASAPDFHCFALRIYPVAAVDVVDAVREPDPAIPVSIPSVATSQPLL